MNETRPIPAPLVSLPFTECSEDDKEVGAALHSLTSGLGSSHVPSARASLHSL